MPISFTISGEYANEVFSVCSYLQFSFMYVLVCPVLFVSPVCILILKLTCYLFRPQFQLSVSFGKFDKYFDSMIIRLFTWCLTISE